MPSPAPLTAVPSPAPVADVVISPAIEVVYTDSQVTMWVSAFIAGGKAGPSGPLAIASATLVFGDGTTTAVSQDCAAPALRLKVDHVYTTAATYALLVSSAELCDPGWQLYLDTGEGIQALAAAAPGTAAWPICTTGQLRMTDGGGGSGLGNVVTLIRLTNVSRSGCNLTGYPDVRLVSATGSLLPTHVRHATDGDYMFPSIAVGRVALAPGDVAAFEIGYGDNPFGPDVDAPYDVACPPARWTRVILPMTHQYGTAAARMAPCEGLVNVSPIYPGPERIQFPAA